MTAVLRIQGLTKAYKPGVPVLKGIDLDFAEQGMTAIIGPSGTGKSTLVRVINRLVDPTEGAILFKGEDLAKVEGRRLREARRRIGMVFQEYNLVERLSVMENLLTGRLGYLSPLKAWLRRFSPEDIEHAFQLLNRRQQSDFFLFDDTGVDYGDAFGTSTDSPARIINGSPYFTTGRSFATANSD